MELETVGAKAEGGERSFWQRQTRPGCALEDLRRALFNELRTSEGAKCQQQRFCGPTVALTFNFMLSVGIIMQANWTIWTPENLEDLDS
ncbi:hypothetical protein MRB53_028679 [Persea americana]|uniref:Uncharacterized protein n=1 Tax=Persea americana TaxID=3435 RepID=A0ACC2KG71_PERAE|nr:hypothetical protein MRB53_028679 [Persea americana]